MNLSDALGLSALTETRKVYHAASHDPARSPEARVGYWLGHKVIVLCSLGCNLLAASVGLGLTAGSALTLGSVKVFIYALTLGNIQPSFPSGFVYFGEFTLRSNGECLAATWDLAEDSFQVAYKGFKAVKWTFDQLSLTHLFTKMMHQLGRALEFTFKRIAIGGEAAVKDEEGLVYQGFPLLTPLDRVAGSFRIDIKKETRSFTEIGAHTLLSIPNIPLHLTASICSSIAASILTGAFITKALIHAATGIHIPIPTGASYAIHAACDTGLTTVKEASNDFCDVFITVYKTADLLHITTVAAKLFNLLMYIPKAVFS